MRIDAVHGAVKVNMWSEEDRKGRTVWRVRVERGRRGEGLTSSSRHVCKADAEAARDAAIKNAAKLAPLSFEELIEQYLLAEGPDGRQRIKARTVETIRGRLLHFGVHEMLAKNVTPEIAEAWYEAYRAEHAVATHHDALSRVKGIWAWAVKEQLVRANVWDRVEQVGKKRRGKVQLRSHEAGKLMHHCMAILVDPSSSAFRVKQATFALLAQLAQLRAGEILGLTGRDIDQATLAMPRGTLLWVAQGDAKDEGGRVINGAKGDSATAKRRVRLLPVPDEGEAIEQVLAQNPALAVLVTTLRRFADETPPHGRVFPYSGKWAWRAVTDLCEEVSVPRVCPQALRGGGATELTEEGFGIVAVARRLGHADRGHVAGRHYVNPEVAAQKAAENIWQSLAPGVPAVSPPAEKVSDSADVP